MITDYVPKDEPIQSYKDYVKTWPNEDGAQVFGQHPNADVIFLTRQSRLLCESLADLQERFNGSPDNGDKENEVLFQLSQILQKLPALIDRETLVKNIEITKNPMDYVLLQEVP